MIFFNQSIDKVVASISLEMYDSIIGVLLLIGLTETRTLT